MNQSPTLWQFALGFYACGSVPSACLQLQEEAGADVAIVLFLLFAASRGQEIAAEKIHVIDADMSSWRSGVIANLRRARRALKACVEPSAKSLREAVKNAELEAERLQLIRLEKYLDDVSQRSREESFEDVGRLALRNLQGYCAILSDPNPAHIATLETCLRQYCGANRRAQDRSV